MRQWPSLSPLRYSRLAQSASLSVNTAGAIELAERLPDKPRMLRDKRDGSAAGDAMWRRHGEGVNNQLRNGGDKRRGVVGS